jgi:protein-disulfide isomerase
MSQKSVERANERNKERAEERRKLDRRRRLVTLGTIAVVVVIVIVGLLLVANAPSEAPLPSEQFARYEGVPQTVSDDGYPMLGRSNARVQVVAYGAFTEPQAYEFYRDIFPSLLDRVKANEISFAFAPLKTAVGRNPEGAARAALCAGEQGKFWQAFDTFFEWANQFDNSAFNTNRIRAGVDALGLDAGVFNDCFGQGRINDLMVKAQQGLTSPVVVKVNGATVATNLTAINEQIDTFGPFNVAPEATAEATEAMTPEATMEATAEATEEATIEATEEANATVAPTEEATEEATAEATVGS